MTTETRNRSQQIVAQATDLFAKHGYAGTSIRRIARACSITEAAIYRHFASKLHLYEEVIRAKAAEHDIVGHLAEHVGRGTILDALVAVSSHVMRLTREDPTLVRLMFHNALESGDVPTVLFQEIRMPYIDFLTREFERRIDEGEIAPVKPFLTGRCFVGMVLDCALNLGTWETLFPDRNQPVDIYSNTAAIFANGLLNKRDNTLLGALSQPGSAS